MSLTYFNEELMEVLAAEEIAYLDRSEYDDDLNLIEDSFEIKVYLTGKYGVSYPISIVKDSESADLDLRFILFNENQVAKKQLVDLCNYLIAHYVFLRWNVHGEESDVCAVYTMTLSDDEEENVPRLMHHINVFAQVLDEVYPLVLRALWEDSYE